MTCPTFSPPSRNSFVWHNNGFSDSAQNWKIEHTRFSHVDDGFNIGLEPSLADFHQFHDEEEEKGNRKKLSNNNQDSYDENGKKKRKRRKRKIVHKIITRKMVKDEEYRKQVDEKIYKELAIPSAQEYTGPQYELRLV